MASVSVAEAARRLGVGVPRIHQRIADGSLRADRVGSQWIVDELSLLRVAERRAPGRPLSYRSAWAIVSLAENDDEAMSRLAPTERARAQSRLEALLELAVTSSRSEGDVRHVASVLRLMLRNRAQRLQFMAAEADLPALREDGRWQSLMSNALTGTGWSGVDGYIRGRDIEALSRDFLLMPADYDPNVIVHALPKGQRGYPESTLLTAADLADQRGAREELRAGELLRDMAHVEQS